ncbi:MAG: class I SAM-dependent methyltransferase [Proteobacteria bacterium]|nr:class I SAM-dependent methyltransferase [Pseudomonadota bacterium]
MTPDAATADFQCPRCRHERLARGISGWSCQACGVDFPIVGGIPWLFPDPAFSLGEWRNRLTLYLEEFRAAERAAEASLAAAERRSTRDRLLALLAGYRGQGRLVRSLCEPLSLPTLPLPHATPLAFGTRLPLSQDLHSYYVNVHRDWSWGAAENAASHAIVADALGSPVGRVLVLGAGACRLAYDLHQAGAQAQTVALDINPLLLFVAARLLAGEPVRLYEFPIAPLRGLDVAVERELRAPAPARPGLHLVFADAWRAPFAAQSFDAVLTPWLIDIVEIDLPAIAAAVNRLLVPGGRWVNFGSLAFPWREPSRQYGPDELADIAQESGFEVVRQADASLPYMQSPASRHGRVETVAVLAADKRQRAPRDADETGVPNWLLDPSVPVPRTQSFALAADATRIQAVVLALVDGRRSMREVASILVEQRLLPEPQASSAVRGLLERMHRSGERGERA